MLRMLLTLSIFALVSSPVLAAAVPSPDGQEQTVPTAEPGIIVAQNGDYEVYFDGKGNRVIVDSFTGKVVAIQPPQTRLDRRSLRLDERRRQLRQQRDDRYYLDDPEDLARLRRRQMEEEGGLYPPVQESDPYSEAIPLDDGSYGEAYPEEPQAPRDVQRGKITSEPLDQASIDSAEPEVVVVPAHPGDAQAAKLNSHLALGAREDVAALQVLMDRVGASPGVIDGRFGSNVDKALAAYREITGTQLRTTDTVGITEALARTGGDAFASYTITAEDAAGPYVASVPSDYSDKAKLDRLSFTTVTEALAERFHMDENYLKALNPEANFNRPGTIIKVANFGRLVSTPVARILADKAMKQVRAYDAEGKLVAAYPATIGSTDTPSPSGTHAVTRVALDPNYTYNPKINFKQGENDKVLTIPPGPNGPVGSVWIALDKPTYGIHGTPDPTKIGKTESHGCVRLTNWDARELAKLVKPGVTVEFMD
ncbi:L,D-transpeptidase family protein [Mesorhizobium sp. A623]